LPIVLGLGHDEALERREVMRQPFHRRREAAEVPQLGQHEVDRHRQLGRGEDLFANAVEDFLGGHVLPQPRPQHLKEMHLLDVFFTRQR
jgi:hypothetical protein